MSCNLLLICSWTPVEAPPQPPFQQCCKAAKGRAHLHDHVPVHVHATSAVRGLLRPPISCYPRSALRHTCIRYPGNRGSTFSSLATLDSPLSGGHARLLHVHQKGSISISYLSIEICFPAALQQRLEVRQGLQDSKLENTPHPIHLLHHHLHHPLHLHLHRSIHTQRPGLLGKCRCLHQNNASSYGLPWRSPVINISAVASVEACTCACLPQPIICDTQRTL
jgi:hypothetical protein